MRLNDIRERVGELWKSVTDGWERLRQTAAGALTRYRPSDRADLPMPAPVRSDKSRASYRNGVLRVKLPKQSPGKSSIRQIRVT